MGTIFALNDRIQAVNIRATIVKSVDETKYAPVAFVRGQLHYGEDKTGHQIAPKYKSEGYAIAKEELNPVPGLGTPDLFVTGDFYNGIQEVVNATGYSFTIESNDEKAPKLELKYGEDIYGLNEENQGYYATEVLKPRLIINIKNELGL